jgi:RNA polymerase sigma-70 factor (ECF subfamily)
MEQDEELMQRVATGDLRAFDELVRRHQRSVWRAALRFTGDPAEAEDLAQDAFLKVLAAAPRYRPAGAFRGYLLTTVARTCLDWVRKRKPAVLEAVPEIEDPAPKPDQSREVNERDRSIRRALAGLPERQRMAVILRYYEALGYAEIAQILEVTPKAVERLLWRARETLRKVLPRSS